MKKFPPKTRSDFIKYLKNLGFIEKQRIGRKRHPNKLYHPTSIPNKNKYPNQPPFIIIPGAVSENQIKYLLKELECWDTLKVA